MPNELYAVLELLDNANVPGGSILDRVKGLLADRDRLERAVETNARKSSKARLVEELAADPNVLLHAIADACIEEDDPEEAGWRWLAMRHRWPVRLGRSWAWSPQGNAGFNGAVSHELPPDVYAEVVGSHPTHLHALLAVVRAVAKLPVEEVAAPVDFEALCREMYEFLDAARRSRYRPAAPLVDEICDRARAALEIKE